MNVDDNKTRVLIPYVHSDKIKRDDRPRHLEPCLMESGNSYDVPIRELAQDGEGPYLFSRCQALVTRELLDAKGKPTQGEGDKTPTTARYTVRPHGGTLLCTSDPGNSSNSWRQSLAALTAVKAWFDIPVDEDGNEPIGALASAPKIHFEMANKVSDDEETPWISACFTDPATAALLEWDGPCGLFSLLGVSRAVGDVVDEMLSLACCGELVVRRSGDIDLKILVTAREQHDNQSDPEQFFVDIRPASRGRVLDLDPKRYPACDITEYAGIRFAVNARNQHTASFEFLTEPEPSAEEAETAVVTD